MMFPERSKMILLTAGEARSFEALARERLAVPERTLIARAGLAAAALLESRCGPFAGKRIAVFCGKGNNAADGLVLARHAAQQGAAVAAVLAFPETAMAPEALWALREARLSGVSVGSESAAEAALTGVDVAVDALVGTGARLPLAGSLEALVKALEAFPGRVLALDLPSGLDPDTGAARGACVRATWTLSFLSAKLGLALGAGPTRCGEIQVADLGADAAWACATASLFDLDAARRTFAPRPRDYHKKKAELLVIAGSKDYLGAALLCARGAYRCGAGMVRLVLPAALVPFAQTALPEAVFTGFPVEEALGVGQLQALLDLAGSCQAAVVGPGLGRRPETAELVRELWARLPRPAVFDADALHALSLGARPGAERILTPHEGEFIGLMGPGALEAGRVHGARSLAAAASAVALLKGPSTLVATPDGLLSVNVGGSPVLATAGSGDVLSGAIGALLAQGMEPFHAAALGAWAHGRAGDAWARGHGDRGLLASDLAEGFPAALAEALPLSPVNQNFS
jgi:NAD(P)H-hydrate epimerase